MKSTTLSQLLHRSVPGIHVLSLSQILPEPSATITKSTGSQGEGVVVVVGSVVFVVDIVVVVVDAGVVGAGVVSV